jgi:drug/metabolite transporter (DMT)-like permease
VSAAAWAVYALAQKQLLEKLSSSSILMIIYAVCAVIFSFFANPQSILQLSPFYLLLLIFCVFDTLVAYGAFSEALNHLEASKVGALLPLSPIITLIATWILSLVAPNLMEPEHISILGGLGGGLVVAGSMAIALGQKN